MAYLGGGGIHRPLHDAGGGWPEQGRQHHDRVHRHPELDNDDGDSFTPEGEHILIPRPKPMSFRRK